MRALLFGAKHKIRVETVLAKKRMLFWRKMKNTDRKIDIKTMLFFLFFCFAPALFSLPFEQKITTSLGSIDGQSYTRPHFYLSFSDMLIYEPFSLYLGTEFSRDQWHLNLEPSWTFLKLKYADFGLRLLYHYTSFLKIAQEHDVFYGMESHIRLPKDISLYLDLSFMQKYTVITSIKESVPFLLNNGMAFSLRFEKAFFENLSPYFIIASYDRFYYPLFFFPSYILGFNFKADKNWTAFSELSVHYTDQFTLTATLTSVNFQLGLTYSIPKNKGVE